MAPIMLNFVSKIPNNLKLPWVYFRLTIIISSLIFNVFVGNKFSYAHFIIIFQE